MHFAMQASLLSALQVLAQLAEQPLAFASACVAFALASVQVLALALVALADLDAQHPDADLADAAVAFVFSALVSVQAEPALVCDAQPGPAWATELVNNEVRQQPEPQSNCPDTNDPPATRTNAAVRTTAVL
jgi:hypothetical protein